MFARSPLSLFGVFIFAQGESTNQRVPLTVSCILMYSIAIVAQTVTLSFPSLGPEVVSESEAVGSDGHTTLVISQISVPPGGNIFSGPGTGRLNNGNGHC